MALKRNRISEKILGESARELSNFLETEDITSPNQLEKFVDESARPEIEVKQIPSRNLIALRYHVTKSTPSIEVFYWDDQTSLSLRQHFNEQKNIRGLTYRGYNPHARDFYDNIIHTKILPAQTPEESIEETIGELNYIRKIFLDGKSLGKRVGNVVYLG